MGACMSAGAPAQLLDKADGNEQEYHERYLEDQILGEGEFGQVKMVHDVKKKSDKSLPLASKVLRKGVVFKDNVLYSPLKPEILQTEVNMLRTLAGKHYCLKLVGVYEGPKLIYVVTEFCGGGEMMEYVSGLETDLRTEDVSRVAFQLLSAVDHCAKHNILHRDIKPENVMFQDPSPRSPIRLIDFGSGCMDTPPASGEPLRLHTTFAGTAFYTSPELFQRNYTSKTDVFSVGALLYVLVAGYPADSLQKAFNILQSGKKSRDLRKLPGMPGDMPDSYYEMLDKLLTYKFKNRPTAGDMLTNEFVQFHKELEQEEQGLSVEQIAAAAHKPEDGTRPDRSLSRRTASIRLTGSVGRHALFLGFKKYERALTTLLATMLTKQELKRLLKILQDRVKACNTDGDEDLSEFERKVFAAQDNSHNNENSLGVGTWGKDGAVEMTNEQKLHVIPVKELKAIVKDELESETAVETMEKLPNGNLYNDFAYHVALLIDFYGDNAAASGGKRHKRSSSMGIGKTSSTKFFNAGIMTDSANSAKSGGSLRAGRSSPGRRASAKEHPSSVHGSNVFAKQRRTQSVYL